MFLNNVAVLKVNSLSIRTAISVQSWYEDHEEALRHLLWPVRSRDLNIRPPWSVLREQDEKQVPSYVTCQATRRLFCMKSGTVFH